jgi:hypothetical protein
MDIQSGIVLAVIIGAVLLVDRLGDTDELARRLFQVALGVAFAYFVFSGTTAFIRVAGNPSDSQILSGLGSNDSSGAARELANRFVAARAADFSVGVLAILFGIGGLWRWRTVPLGIAVGGLLLVLASGTGGGASAYQLVVLADTSLHASRAANAVNFAILGIGFAGLLWFGFTTWERDSDEASGEDDGAAPARDGPASG